MARSDPPLTVGLPRARQILEAYPVMKNGAGLRERKRQLMIREYMCETCERLLAAGAKCPSGHPLGYTGAA